MMSLSMSPNKIVLLVVLFLLAVGFYQYRRPTSPVAAVPATSTAKTSAAIDLPWPAYGQGALATQDLGLLQKHGEQKAVPIASVAKVVTALAVLKQKPLAVGQQGPTITINSGDVAIYNSYYSQGGSVVKVENGEQLSQLEALQALLIPSANNIADTLAIWAFGSMDNYLSYANKMVAGMHLGSTKIADASGLSPQTLSTAEDLVKLGLVAIENPVLVSLVAQQTASLPVAGSVKNVNWLLGEDGVVGIKTGNTDEAGGCFLFVARRSIAGQTVSLIGALMQAPDLNTVIADSRRLIRASDGGFETVKAVAKGQAVGTYKTPWGATTNAVADQDLSLLAWRGSQIQVTAKLSEVKAPAKAGAVVGLLSVASGQKTTSVPAVLKSGISSPPWYWRLLH